MNWAKGSKGFVRVTICPRGHDKDQLGRVAKGACAQCNRDRTKAWCKAHPQGYTQYGRNYQWKRLGVRNADGSSFLIVDYDRAYQVQQGKCAICDIHASFLKSRFHVDHNHKTGAFRALLCGRCNQALGLAMENPAILRKLASFIEEQC